MSDSVHTEAHDHSHPPSFYYKVYGVLLCLLVVSIVGPMMGGLTVLLVTAFGVAVVKALMVAAYFMHLNIERKYIWWVLVMAVCFLLVLFYGVAPDVMKSHGVNWKSLSTPPPAAAEPAHH
ncbi:MAG: cytochrome C oxidase subunit IV family protein [Verrucomicrobiaceae bacterium]|nr:cytochrome C oxidase subunit IV family protein [Verrucomicrobiaceae bacterium]